MISQMHCTMSSRMAVAKPHRPIISTFTLPSRWDAPQAPRFGAEARGCRHCCGLTFWAASLLARLLLRWSVPLVQLRRVDYMALLELLEH